MARPAPPWRSERGSAVVEFALVAVIAVSLTLAVVQLGLFLYERNVVMGAVAEGARVAATYERGVDDGERMAGTLVRQAVGERVAATVRIDGAAAGDLVAVSYTHLTLPTIYSV